MNGLARGCLRSSGIVIVALSLLGLTACTGKTPRNEGIDPAPDVVSHPRLEAQAEPTPDPADLTRAQNRSDLSADETLVLYPTWLAPEVREDGSTLWRGRILGWIFEPEEDDAARRVFLDQLRELFGGDDAPLTSQLVVERVRPFIYDDERGEKLSVQVGTEIFDARPSSAAGRFGTEVVVQQSPKAGLVQHATARAVPKRGDTRVFEAPLFLLPSTGTLVISDIDDTIKHTNVRDLEAMVRATFAEPFRFVDGMAERYEGWVHAGNHLHFVSASPWQLYEPLRIGIEAAGFPAATFTLRDLRMDAIDLVKIMQNPGGLKSPAIGDMLARLPGWKVVLVGDSGERDPEIYARIAKRYPDQVLRVFIRDVTGEAREAQRYQAAFEGLPAERWMIFNNASQLPAQLPEG